MTKDNGGTEIKDYVRSLSLVDNHCHSVSGSELSLLGFSNFLRESPPRRSGELDAFRSMVGMTLLKHCPQVLGGESFESPQTYVSRRGELSPSDVVTRFMSALGVRTHLIDTGFNSSDLISIEDLSIYSGTNCLEIVRVEAVAESLLAEVGSAEFMNLFPSRLGSRAQNAIALKSVAAYRGGLSLSAVPPDKGDVKLALDRILGEAKLRGALPRMEGTLVESYLVHTSLEVCNLPIQFHIGFGDPDIQLDQTNPSLLTPVIKRAASMGRKIVLLHCYPYHRSAAYLAHAFENVYLDLGLTMNYVGSRSSEILKETLELAPFVRLMYSSDAYGLPELHFLGQLLFREALGSTLETWVSCGVCSESMAVETAELIAYRNADKLYGLQIREKSPQ
jgi:predicted TIM-barrel fold metal-dependent hydrolase